MLEPLPRRQEDFVHVDVVIGLTDGPTEAPSILYVGSFALPYDQARLVRDEVERLVYGKAELSIIQTSGGHFNWGADAGATETVILFISDAVFNGVIGALVAALYQKFFGVQQSNDLEPERWHVPLTPEQAVSHARWVVLSRYSELSDVFGAERPDEEQLELISECEDKEAKIWTVALRDREGVNYLVKLGAVGGVPTTASIQRTLRMGNDEG